MVYVINEVIDTHQRPSLGKTVVSDIEGVDLHSIVKHRENKRRHTPEIVGEEVQTMLATPVPSVENIRQQVDVTSPSIVASPMENRGVSEIQPEVQDREHHLVSTLKRLPKRLGRLAKTILEASIMCKGIVCGLTLLSFGVAYICYPLIAVKLFTSPILFCLVPLLMVLLIWLFYSKPVATESV